jgi:hypothetical protein
VRLKRNRRRSIVKSRNRRRKLTDRRRAELERLEDRQLLAADLATGGMMYAPPQFHDIGTDQFLAGPSFGSPLQIGLDYVRAHADELGVSSGDLETDAFQVADQYTDASTGVTHIYLRQLLNGLQISQADLNINVGRDGEIISVGSTFLPLQETAVLGDQPTLAPISAYEDFAEVLDFQFSEGPEVLESETTDDQTTIISAGGLANQDVVAELRYVPTEAGLELAWRLEVPILHEGHWYDAGVSAVDGELISLSDRVKNASYQVFPSPLGSPLEGGRSIVVDPQDPIASPFGWHDVNGLPGAEFFDTRGNNVVAQQDRLGDGQTTLALTAVARPSGGAGLNFSFPLDLSQNPETYTDASVTSLFYLTNVIHDAAFRYGFDEAAGNFQSTNYTGTGLGGDAVVAFAQSGAGLPAPTLNNAFFVPTPDGQAPLMIIFENNFDLSDPVAGPILYSPNTDSALEAETIFHEYAHGISDRLVGGKSNVAALVNLQSLGLAEGWSDYMALALTQQTSDQINDAFPMFDFSNGPSPVNPGTGLRRFPYSFDTTTNPLTYGNFNLGTTAGIANTESHNAGEIWASALWDMSWSLVEKYGFDADLAAGSGGNNLAMQLVLDGMKLAPANPSFLDARDAILSADFIRNQGVNHQQIWGAFGRRGMGLSAVDDITATLGSNSDMVRESFDLPTPISTVSGRIFADANANGVRDGFEGGLADAEVFIDLNTNGRLDPQEPSTRTDADGNYSFDFLVPGVFEIATNAATGLVQTFPAVGNQAVTVTVTSAGPLTADFGLHNAADGQLTGVVFHDIDGDRRREVCEIITGTLQPPCQREAGVPGVWVYVDYDNDGRIDIGEPSAISGTGGIAGLQAGVNSVEDGQFVLDGVRDGNFFLRQVLTPGWTQTAPGGASLAHVINVKTGSLGANLDFGLQSNLDFGDAPDTYRTSAASGGPIAPIIAGFHLGSSVDSDLDGTPSAGADGDDNNRLTSDEDGVVFTSIVSPGSPATVDITVSSGEYSAGRVNAWLDFNGDGDFDDSGEHIIVDDRQFSGTDSYTFPVPDAAVSGLTFARVTYGYHRYKAGDSPTIRDIAGEIEDHQVRVVGSAPDAMDDQFRLDQNSAANQLDVLANDITSRNGPIFIESTSAPSRGGRVSISADGLNLSYTPPTGFAGVEMFTYVVRDQAGTTDTATVTTTIVPDTPALAVDDSFDVLEGSTDNVLDVLRNDLAGQNPPIQILDVVGSANSTVTVDRRGTPSPEDDLLLYTPNAGFNGSDQFSYIISDALGLQSAGTVTVHNQPSVQNDDVIEYELEVTDLTGNPISAIGAGQQFLLQGYVRDLRVDDGDGDPIDRRGVAAGYLDVLYDLSLVSVSGGITFGADYQNATSGSSTIPGLIDEVGGLQTNSIPLGADRVMLFSIPLVANAAGAATFTGDPADQRMEVNPGSSPDHDSLLFQPPSNILLQNMRFTNSMLSIVSSGAVPVAVDNTFQVAADNSINNSLDVLANDLDNGNPPLRVVSITQGDRDGQVVIGAGAGNILYRPAAGVTGVEQFRYTVQNGTGLTSSATVTVQVGDNAKSLRYRLETVPAGPIAVGTEFEVRAFIQDIRANDGDGNPRDDRGAFAAYFDVLFDSNLVSPVSDSQNPLGFDINFAAAYQNSISGDVDTANVIDEAGAFQISSIPLGPTEQLLFSVTMRADAAGTATFQSDPADTSPLHDSLLFEPTSAVPVNDIDLGSTTITIGAGEGERTNPANHLDVNNDGTVSPIDPLLVVNYLNRKDAEGELSSMYLDVSGDGHVSPIDALELVNFLNRRGPVGEAEGEGSSPLTSSHEADSRDGGTPLLRPNPGSPATGSSVARLPELLGSATANDPTRAERHQEALAQWSSDRHDSDALDELLSDEDLTQDILDGWGQ